MSARTIRCGSSTPSLTDWTLRRRGFFAGSRRKRWGVPATRRATFSKLYIYGYLNRVRSSRRPGERECHRNIEVTLAVADFETGLQDHRRFPAQQSRGVSRRVPPVRYCCCRPAPRPMYSRESCWRSTEHRIKAVNNKDRNLHPLFAASSSAAPTRMRGWKTTSSGSTRAMSRTARRTAAAHEEPGRKDCGAQRKARPVTKRCWPSSTEPARTRSSLSRSRDSRAMAAHTKVGVGYNVQVAVDAKNKLIVEQAVTNQVVDMGLLTETSEPAREILGVRDDRRRPRIARLLQDRRHRRPASRPAALPTLPSRSAARRCASACFARTSSDTTPGSTPTVCPAGKLLTPIRRGRMRDLEEWTRLRQPESLPRLPAAPAVHERRPRSVFRLENEDVLDRMAERALKAKAGGILDRRREVVEHPFGSIKQWMLSEAFLMREPRQRARRVQPALTALAYNLRRALNILGVEAMKRPR